MEAFSTGDRFTDRGLSHRRARVPGWIRSCFRVALVLATCVTAAESEAAEAARGPAAFKPNDVIVFTGGANAVAAQDNGYLELLITLGLPDLHLRFRNLAWEGDTVYEQRRDLNFGPWSRQFERIGATVIFAQFGQMESLGGQTLLPGFVAAYDQLLDQFSKQTERLILISPVPFQKSVPPLPDLSTRNGDLERFVKAIRQIALRRGCRFVDVFDPLRHPETDAGPTVHGVELTAQGHWSVARETARQLGLEAPSGFVQFDSTTGRVSPPLAEQLRQRILAKNRLWFDYWRPMNWAFLAGDRTEQPSSRDHRDPKVRW